MPTYRRAKIGGGTYFFTLVTSHRAQILCQPSARRHLRQAVRQCQQRQPFQINAFVLLPDHLHTVWTLPPNDANYPLRWSQIKAAFTHRWLASGGKAQPISESKRTDRRQGVWQRRYWEHVIRDETDLARHLDYIHFNPVKHGHVRCPSQWPWSSFHRHVHQGVYPSDWCCRHDDSRPLDFSDIADRVGE